MVSVADFTETTIKLPRVHMGVYMANGVFAPGNFRDKLKLTIPAKLNRNDPKCTILYVI